MPDLRLRRLASLAAALALWAAGAPAAEMPPVRLVPPMTDAAITDSSIPWPRLVVTVPSQPTSRMPVTPAHRLQNM